MHFGEQSRFFIHPYRKVNALTNGRGVRSGAARIVIGHGQRCSFPSKPGPVMFDEEHESTYRQRFTALQRPRHRNRASAKTISRGRARFCNAFTRIVS